MLTKSELVLNYIDTITSVLATERKEIKNLCDEVHNHYLIPQGEIMDIINHNIKTEDMDLFIMYAIIDTANVSDRFKNYNFQPAKQFFTPVEIKSFSGMKYEKDVLKFPIKIKCIQVTNNQWIGAVDTNFLIALRNNQMINYNTNAQRTMRSYKKGSVIEYKIFLNKTAIKEISKAFKDGSYIPDTITLGIVDEAEPDFYYDEDMNELVINDIKYFDIPDGYHRYIAMGIAKDTDKNFNYPMELRIVNFTEDKTKQFIFQQDQKTKMRKADSNSMNMNAIENIILERLNDDSRFYLQKEISRNEGKINMPLFATCVNYYFLKPLTITKSNRNKVIMDVTNQLRDGINKMIDACPWLMEKEKFELLEMMLICYMIKNDYYYNNNMITSWFGKINESGLVEKYRYRQSATKALHTAIEKVIQLD